MLKEARKEQQGHDRHAAEHFEYLFAAAHGATSTLTPMRLDTKWIAS